MEKPRGFFWVFLCAPDQVIYSITQLPLISSYKILWTLVCFYFLKLHKSFWNMENIISLLKHHQLAWNYTDVIDKIFFINKTVKLIFCLKAERFYQFSCAVTQPLYVVHHAHFFIFDSKNYLLRVCDSETKKTLVEDDEDLEEEKKKTLSILQSVLGQQHCSSKTAGKAKKFKWASHSFWTGTSHIHCGENKET